MEIKFIPYDYSYFDVNGKNCILIIGRDENNRKVCIIDFFSPYFSLILKPNVPKKRIQEILKKIKNTKTNHAGRATKVEKAELTERNFLGKPVKAIKVFITNYKDAHKIAEKLDFPEIESKKEYDLNLITKYIIEKEFSPLCWYKISGEILTDEFGLNNLEADLCIKAEKIEKIQNQDFNPKILAFDIEADEFEIGKGEILMISLVTSDFQKVLTWKHATSQEYVEKYKNEEEMIEAFIKYVKKLEPDFLVGYFSDGFDLPYLRARAEKLKIKLSLGIDNSQPKFIRGKIPSYYIPGIVHIDLFKFIETVYSQYLKSETLSLNEVASELLGETKLEFDLKHSSNIKKEEWENYFSYNLQDSLLTYKLAEKFKSDIIEFCRIIKEPPFNITRNSMSQLVEDYLIHQLKKFKEIIERRPLYDEVEKRKSRPRYEGAFVFQPKPGIYENLAIFDFTSMYPSIIITYNLSLSTFLGEKKQPNSYEVDVGNKKYYFSKTPGFFSLILSEIIKLRKKYKKELKEKEDPIKKARSNAYKLLANASYGYLGFFGARYYCPEAAAATTALARKFIKEMIEKTNKEGYEVIYADSVDGKTKVIVKRNKEVYETEIENLFENVDEKGALGKEYNFKKGIKILTLDEKGNSVFKPIKYVMRHKTNKKMYRINFTNNWYIDVTEDHSLMGYQAQKFNQSIQNKINPLKRIIEIKPKEIGKKANTIITLKKIPYENNKIKNYPKELYEFMGYFIGDGSFDRKQRNYYLNISGGRDTKELIKKLIVPLKEKGYIKNFWIYKKGDIKVNGTKLIKIICDNCRKEGKKIIPDWLFKDKEENVASFLRGLFSADGCVMVKEKKGEYAIKYTSTNDEYINQVRKLLYKIGISHSVFKENTINKYKIKNKVYCNNSISKIIWIKDKKTFKEKVGFIFDRKNKLCVIKDSLRRKDINKFEFDIQSVKSIKELKTRNYVYDIEVEGNHKFFANYVLVHNTDGFAFLLNKKTKKQTLEFLEKLNSKLPGVMELELEDFYKRGIWVTKRTREIGAKKKYALITEKGKLKIRGFETVRRDWCNLARKVQNKVIEKILKEGKPDSALQYTKEVIKKLKNREIDKKELIIKTQLKKPLSEYKAVSPHVTIARKMKEKGEPVDIGMLIQYYIAESKEKKALVRERAKLPEEKEPYDINYYIKHQILPAVENIFEVFDINLREFIEGKEQKKLGEF